MKKTKTRNTTRLIEFIRTNKLTIIAFVLGCAITAGCAIFVILRTDNHINNGRPKENIYLEYGDSFNAVPMLSVNNKKAVVTSGNKPYTFVFFLDKACSACLNEMDTIGRINGVFGDNLANVIVLWQSDMLEEVAEKKGVPKTQNYRLDNVYLTRETPSCYILDKNNKIVFTCSQAKELLKKAITLDEYSTENLHSAGIEYLLKTNKNNITDKKMLIYFGMVGCSDCVDAESVLEIDAIKNKYEIVTYYHDAENIPEEKMNLVDSGDVLAKIYGVDWYPSFLIIGQNEHLLIGEETTENLTAKLLQG